MQSSVTAFSSLKYIFNAFANVVRDLQFWHRTANIKAKLVLVPIGSAKPQLGEGIDILIMGIQLTLYFNRISRASIATIK